MISKRRELFEIKFNHCFIINCFIIISVSNFYFASSNDIYLKLRPKASAATQTKAVLDLIDRRFGGDKVQLFNITVDPNLFHNGYDSFKLFKTNGTILHVIASRGVTAALGINHYLKYYCNFQVPWDIINTNEFPSHFPEVDITFDVKSIVYYQNVCTWSYSFPWWRWDDWERHLDWMALNGITTALTFNGQENLWRSVYTEVGLQEREIDEHFSGPAFLAWMRMGNLRGWGGPLPKSYEKLNVFLNKNIVNRMREFGMISVLPSFAGHVPRAFKRIFPTANLTKSAQWCDFEDQYCCPFILSPDEPLFQKIGTLFLKKVIETFGTDHLYSCDTFNEMNPPSGDLNYIKSIGHSTYNSMKEVDKDAIWVIQGWLFHNGAAFWTKDRAKALLTSVPLGSMLVLDLHAEYYPIYKNLSSFFGQPFIWCMLHNFGGTLGLHGSIEAINKGIFEAEKMNNSTMVGIGITPEGINQNYVIYDLMLEMSFQKEPVNLSKWFQDYAQRRYGEQNEHTGKLWHLLMKSVYNYTGIVSNHGKYVVVHTPHFDLVPNTWYDPELLLKAWDEILMAAEKKKSILKQAIFRYDIVDVTRQALQLLIDKLYSESLMAYKKGNIQDFQNAMKYFNEVMIDLDTILLTNEKFLVGTWIEGAKSFGQTPLEILLLERNARNQITLWGPTGEIKDYGNKQWSGLVKDYYAPRWNIFWEALNSSLVNKRKFRPKETRKMIYDTVEEPFSYNTVKYPTKPTGDSFEIAKQLHQKWRNFI